MRKKFFANVNAMNIDFSEFFRVFFGVPIEKVEKLNNLMT